VPPAAGLGHQTFSATGAKSQLLLRQQPSAVRTRHPWRLLPIRPSRVHWRWGDGGFVHFMFPSDLEPVS
jgi:hypothetical protein